MTEVEEQLAAAWESGYWYGTCHAGPLNEAAVRTKNPHRVSDGKAADGDDDAEVTG